ncbi:MAG: hypothetical protein KGN79_11675 [Acidobacteriota bacterium]|nr:hypothetical protein [Acidobacteriota bacterium]
MAMGAEKTAGQMLEWMLSRGLMGVGAVSFVFGDRMLEVISGMGFLPALMVSVLGGLVLCALGYAIASWSGQPFGRKSEDGE